MNLEKSNFPFAGTERRNLIWEKEPVSIVNTIELAEKELGVNLPESLQKINETEITPKNAIEIDNRALKNKDCPNIVFGRPHGGEHVPKALWDSATMEGKKNLSVIDRGTWLLFKSENIASVGTKISRFIVDPNRPPLPGVTIPGTKAMGEVLWKKTIMGTPMYNEGKLPTDEQITALSEKFYLPYYNAMMATIGSLTDRRQSKDERILVIDGHCFPITPDEEFKGAWNSYGIEDLSELPLFILGDREGESCDEDIRTAFIKALNDNFSNLSSSERELLLQNSKAKRLISENEYLKGVRNVQFYGQRSQGVNSFQLELNESSYVDEPDSYYNAEYNTKKMEIMKNLIEKTCLDIDPILKGKS